MTNQTTPLKIGYAVAVLMLLMILTRGHESWLASTVHLPDFTLPALIIAGVYLRKFWVAGSLIVMAVAIDNYAIVHQGVSAHCITPAYSVLIASYALLFWAAKFLTTLTIDKQLFRNIMVLVGLVATQWLVATASYYSFTTAAWAKFASYAAHWSMIEIVPVLSWMLAVSVIFSLNQRYQVVTLFSSRKPLL